MHEKRSRVFFNFKMMLIFMLAFFFSSNAFANPSSDTNNTAMKILGPVTGTPILTKTYKDANTSETNVSKFNTKDWENQFSTNGMTSTPLIGNTLSLFGGSAESKIANSGDIEQLKTASLQKNTALSGNKSIGALSSTLLNSVMNDVTNSAFGKLATTKKDIKCYITRNIGSTYKCTAPNNSLMLSSAMGGRDSISQLKSQCEGQCFTQNACVDMQSDEQNITANTPTLSFTLTKNSPSYTYVISTRNDLTINTLDFVELARTADISYVISYVNLKGQTQTLVSNMISSMGNQDNKEFYIGDIASSITITVSLVKPYVDTINTPITLTNINVNYHTNAKYVCPSIQDVSGFNPGGFANVCNNGSLTTLTRTVGAKTLTYNICAKSNYPGQNIDGSFYQQTACQSVCRKQYSCTLLPGGAVNFEGLKGFQEGCIENTSLDCNNFNNDCAQARLNLNAKVVNELVFGANSVPIATIINGVTTGLERPRLSFSALSPSLGVNGGTYAPNDQEFEDEREQEWKDKAYSSMMNAATWNVSGINIGDNTSVDNAYGINLKSGSFYGFAGTSTRALEWKLKPAAYDVGVGVNYNLYAVLRIIVQNYRYDQSGDGTKKPFFDEIWYVKTGAGDVFKPFYYNYDAYSASVTTDDYNLTTNVYAQKASAIPQYSTFSGGAWGNISASDMAESFGTDQFSVTNAFWQYEIIGDLDNDFNLLPGIIHSITTTNEKDVISYIGPRDYTTSGSIVKLFVSVGYSQDNYSYQALVDMVHAGTIPTIYETGNENSYSRSFNGDGSKNNEITMFLYGKQASGSAYFEIKPQPAYVGKKGFIFVFGQ